MTFTEEGAGVSPECLEVESRPGTLGQTPAPWSASAQTWGRGLLLPLLLYEMTVKIPSLYPDAREMDRIGFLKVLGPLWRKGDS